MSKGEFMSTTELPEEGLAALRAVHNIVHVFQESSVRTKFTIGTATHFAPVQMRRYFTGALTDNTRELTMETVECTVMG